MTTGFEQQPSPQYGFSRSEPRPQQIGYRGPAGGAPSPPPAVSPKAVRPHSKTCFGVLNGRSTEVTRPGDASQT